MIAHIDDNGDEQSIIKHLERVAEYSRNFEDGIGFASLAELIGLLHDLGKYTMAFYQYLHYSYENPNSKAKGPDHSSAGAIWISLYAEEYIEKHNITDKKLLPFIWLTTQLTAMCIMSHHGGLINVVPIKGETVYLDRLEKYKNDNEYSKLYYEAVNNFTNIVNQERIKELFTKAINEVTNVFKNKIEKALDKVFSVGMLCKFLFSCLTNADVLDTKNFMHKTKTPEELERTIIWNLLINTAESKFRRMSKEERINALRHHISLNCMNKYTIPTGIYRLNCPTGSGKNFAVTRWALWHARERDKKRIFYIVPYISIIEQNAKAIRSLLDIENAEKEYGEIVLELHSGKQENNEYTEDDNEELNYSDMVSETMDAPIVFTSMVRFLNVIFGSGTRDIKALHNFANSILIFDEIQTLSPKHIAMFNNAVNFLTTVCNSTIVLSTATQPELSNLPSEKNRLLTNNFIELSGCTKEVYRAFKRTQIGIFSELVYNVAETIDIINNEIAKNDSIMMVLNTKKAVRQLYKEIYTYKTYYDTGDIEIFILSTDLCPEHRSNVIDSINKRLEMRKKTILICTRVVETGVNISFARVLRSIAGLDSVIQCAGRCNRNGEMESGYGQVSIINLDYDDTSRMNDIEKSKRAMREFLYSYKTAPEQFENDMESQSSISQYFTNLNREQDKDIEYKFREKTTGNEYYMYNLLGRNTGLYKSYMSNTGKNSGDRRIAFCQSFKTASKNFRRLRIMEYQ